MKKITSLFISLLLAVSISSLHADHHAKSPEQQIQAALKAGKISKEEANKKLAYIKKKKAEAKKKSESKSKPKNSQAKKKAEQEAAKKRAAAKKKAEQEAAKKRAAAKKKAEAKKK